MKIFVLEQTKGLGTYQSIYTMKVQLTKQFDFEMAHALMNYDGHCKNIPSGKFHPPDMRPQM